MNRHSYIDRTGRRHRPTPYQRKCMILAGVCALISLVLFGTLGSLL